MAPVSVAASIKMGGAELLGECNAVSEDQPAFGVGIQHFNGLAGHSGLHVAGLLRFASHHVFRRGNYADHFHGGLQRGDGAHDAEHGSATGHIVLHFFHAVGGLDGNSSGIEGDRFTDEPDYRRTRLGDRRHVGEDHNARRLRPAL